MIKNYFKIAFRNLWRHKGFSVINIIGLAVGMAACFLIFMYLRFELSYDKFNTNFSSIYRLNTDIRSPNEILHWSSASPPMGPSLQQDFPEVKANARLFGAGFLVKGNNKKFQENNISFTDPAIFKIFTFPFIKGDPDKALVNPFSVVLTAKTAKKYFGSTDVLGKALTLDGKRLVTVTGVISDVPLNSHFNFDMLISSSTMEKMKLIDMNEWGNFSNNTYLLIPDAAAAATLQAKLPGFLIRHISEDKRKNGGYDYQLFVEPLREVYMDTFRGAPINGNRTNTYIFAIVAIFILLIACINFINLTTARASERAKEVGIRKVIGAAKKQLTIQFLGESVIICLISFFVAFILCLLLLPLFNQLAGKTISESIFEHGYILYLLVIAIMIGFLAGIYPALILTNFSITSVIKGRFSSSVKGVLLRKGLVVAQFTIAIVLIVGTIVVYRQLSFMRNQSLGFKMNQMLVIDFSGDSLIQGMRESIKNELRQVPGVLSASGSSNSPGSGNSVAATSAETRSGNMQLMNMNLYDVDYDFIPQYGMKIVAGRAFSTAFATDSTQAFVINESTVKALGYTTANDAVGKNFNQWGRKGKIIGVIKDFHFESLAQTVKPLNLRINPRNIGLLTLTIKGGDIPNTIAAVKAKWERVAPERPFSYYFLDDNFNKQYATEDRFGKLFMYFAVLAILISCLGLLGLASYSTLQRTREIGIRKVLGASVGGIVNMLSKDFLKLVIIAALIAFPLAWFGMHSWLKDFAYRINIAWWIFVTAGLLAMLIAVATVSFQARRAALTNPVKSLRSE